MQHPSDVELLFGGPLNQLREHTVMFAVQHSHEQMTRAVFYKVEEIAQPKTYDWVCYGILHIFWYLLICFLLCLLV